MQEEVGRGAKGGIPQCQAYAAVQVGGTPQCRVYVQVQGVRANPCSSLSLSMFACEGVCIY